MIASPDDCAFASLVVFRLDHLFATGLNDPVLKSSAKIRRAHPGKLQSSVAE
jgi:hypothetical protein